MLDNKTLWLVHGFLNKEKDSDSGHFILSLFGREGYLNNDLQVLKFCTETQIAMRDEKIGPFTGMEQLNGFAYRICEYLDKEMICLLPVQEYNQILSSSQDAQELAKKMEQVGNCLTNISKDKKKWGFFNKIFD